MLLLRAATASASQIAAAARVIPTTPTILSSVLNTLLQRCSQGQPPPNHPLRTPLRPIITRGRIWEDPCWIGANLPLDRRSSLDACHRIPNVASCLCHPACPLPHSPLRLLKICHLFSNLILKRRKGWKRKCEGSWCLILSLGGIYFTMN